LRGQPDFGLESEPFGTQLNVNIPEPSVQVFYHF